MEKYQYATINKKLEVPPNDVVNDNCTLILTRGVIARVCEIEQDDVMVQDAFSKVCWISSKDITLIPFNNAAYSTIDKAFSRYAPDPPKPEDRIPECFGSHQYHDIG